MPQLTNFRSLIVAIPISRHSVEVDGEFWKRFFKKERLSHIHKNIFNSNKTVRISREKILLSRNGMEKCALVLLWGYTKGMRGNQHEKYLKNLKKISEACSTPKTWEEFLLETTRHIGNLGISTITKLAYFHSIQFKNNPALILDQRIISILAKSHWEELESLSHIKYDNAKNNYVEYLEKMNAIANKLNVNGAQLEFFLFGMGNVFD